MNDLSFLGFSKQKIGAKKILFAFFLLPFFCLSQTSSDSLKTSLGLSEVTKLVDSLQTERAYDLVRAIIVNNHHRQEELDLKAAQLLEEIGKQYFRANDMPKVIESFGLAIEVYDKTSLRLSEEVANLHNNLGIALRRQWLLKEALFHFEKSLATRLAIYEEPVLNIAKSYNNIGVILSDLGRNSAALESYQLSLSVKKKLPDTDSLDIAATYLNIGGLYMEIKNTLAAEENFNKVFSILEDRTDEAAKILASRLYNNLAGAFTYRRDYYKSISYHEKSIALREEIYGLEHLETARGYENLSAVYMEMGKLAEAKVLCEKSYAITSALSGDSSVYTAISYLNLGSIYGKNNQYKEAKDYLHKAIKRFIWNVSENHIYTAESYNSLAGVHKLLGEMDTALVYYRKFLSIHKAISEAELSTDILRARFNIGLLYKESNQFAQAITTFNELIEDLKTLEKIPPEDQFIYFETLLNKAELFAWTAHQPVTETINLFEQALQVGEEFRGELEEVYSIAEFLALSKRASEGLIQMLINNPENKEESLKRAFTTAEKSIGFLLREGLRETQGHRYAGLPDSLLSLETALRQQIAEAEVQLYIEKNSEPVVDSLVNFYNNQVIQFSRNYEALKDYLRQEHPQYYRQRYDYQVQTVEEVQEVLLTSSEQSLVSYFLGDSSLFIFLVQKDNIEVREIDIDSTFFLLIRMMTSDGIYGYYNAPTALQSRRNYGISLRNYSTAATELYQKLIAPIADKLKKEVIVVPDGVLGYLPFEALLQEAPNDPANLEAYQYAIYRYQFSYAYSATLLREMRDKKHQKEPSKDLLALAPFFEGEGNFLLPRKGDQGFQLKNNASTDSLSVLYASGLEVKAISEMMEGDAFYGKEATRRLFESKSDAYRILHLSTHAKANDLSGDYAFLAFAGDELKEEYAKFYARDLYSLSLNTDMVVLSACETAKGELKRGDGIFSLGRAFAYAGAKSIFMTLWKVEENATRDLIISFYQYLGQGWSKDRALHRAKLDFINSRADVQNSHPFFWASLVGLGDMRPLPKE